MNFKSQTRSNDGIKMSSKPDPNNICAGLVDFLCAQLPLLARSFYTICKKASGVWKKTLLICFAVPIVHNDTKVETSPLYTMTFLKNLISCCCVELGLLKNNVSSNLFAQNILLQDKRFLSFAFHRDICPSIFLTNSYKAPRNVTGLSPLHSTCCVEHRRVIVKQCIRSVIYKAKVLFTSAVCAMHGMPYCYQQGVQLMRTAT